MNRLPLVLSINGASCILFGFLFLFAPAQVAAFLADPAQAPALLVLVLGAALLLNGAGLFLVAGSKAPNRHAIRFFSLGDLLWVLATLALIITGVWIDRVPGILAALAVAVFVGTMGWLQWRMVPAKTA